MLDDIIDNHKIDAALLSDVAGPADVTPTSNASTTGDAVERARPGSALEGSVHAPS